MSFEWPLALLALLLVAGRGGRLRPAGATAAGRRRRRMFASPALFPNVVGRSPGRLRHVPVADAADRRRRARHGLRPAARHALRQAERGHRHPGRRRVSRSMTAKDVKPTRLAAAGDAIARFLERRARLAPRRRRPFADRAAVVAPPTTRPRRRARCRSSEARPGEGTALGDALLLALRSARSVRDENNEPPPASILRHLRRRPDAGHRHADRRRRQAREGRRRPDLHRRRSARPNGSSRGS